MALYAEISLRADSGITQVDIEVDEVRHGLHLELWRRTSIVGITAEQEASQAEQWLHDVLSALLGRLGGEVLVLTAPDEPAAARPAETTLDLGELDRDEPPAPIS